MDIERYNETLIAYEALETHFATLPLLVIQVSKYPKKPNQVWTQILLKT